MNLPRIEIFGDDDIAAFGRKLVQDAAPSAANYIPDDREPTDAASPIGFDIAVTPQKHIAGRPQAAGDNPAATAARNGARRADGAKFALPEIVGFDATPARGSDRQIHPDFARSLSARLDLLISEFVKLQTQLLKSVGGSVSLQQRLTALFGCPLTGKVSRVAVPGEEISPGIVLSFADDARVALTVEPKLDHSLSPESYLNKLSLVLTGSSEWLELRVAYDAILRGDSDFYLWYYCSGATTRQDGTGLRRATVVRWSDCYGRILVWKSRRTFLNLQSTGYWLPLRIDLPLPPRGVSWLRFDLITDGGSSPDPLCTGFLFAGRENNLPRPHRAAFEVLGLSRLANDGASAGENGCYIEDIGRTCPERRVRLRMSRFAADMMLLESDEVPGLEALYFVGWEGLGRPLVGVRLPKRAPNPPVTLALPGTLTGRVYGYGSPVGFVRLAAETAASAGR
jgi:hypothetical protein